MDSKALEELRNKYIKNPPEGMTAKLVKNMSDSDLLDMSIYPYVIFLSGRCGFSGYRAFYEGWRC